MPEAEFFRKLEEHSRRELPFVAYRKPVVAGASRTVTAFLQRNIDLHCTEDFTGSGFVFAPFDGLEKSILFPENSSEKIIYEQVISKDITTSVTSQKVEISEEKKLEHVKLVRKALTTLQKEELNKVVLSRQEEVEIPGKDPLKLFRELLEFYPTAFVYCWYHPDIGCWLGATPESLLSVQSRRFKTMALAGTQKYSGTVNVAWGEKEQQEQRYVTDSIVDNLTSCGVEDLEISAPFTAKAGNLLHIRTDIEGNIPNSTSQSSGGNSGTATKDPGLNKIKEIIEALHPTPAVCGLPKQLAKAFILSEENYDREFYTGFLGELNLQNNVQRSRTKRNVENLAYRAVKKETDLYVNLRCMKIEDEKAFLFIGGGITKDSNPEAEWEETVNKAQTMKKVLLKS